MTESPPMEFSDELELVPEEFRHEFQDSKSQPHIEHSVRSSFVHPEEEIKEKLRRQGYPHVDNLQVCVNSKMLQTEKRFVYVTFYTHLDKKVVAMYLDERHAKEQVAQKAAELLPTIQWKIFSGNQHRADFEFLYSHQIWNSIKRFPICRFYYLLVRLERLHPYHAATCDECRQSIIGHRYKCTVC